MFLTMNAKPEYDITEIKHLGVHESNYWNEQAPESSKSIIHEFE